MRKQQTFTRIFLTRNKNIIIVNKKNVRTSTNVINQIIRHLKTLMIVIYGNIFNYKENYIKTVWRKRQMKTNNWTKMGKPEGRLLVT